MTRSPARRRPRPPSSTTPKSPMPAPIVRANAASTALPRPPARVADNKSGEATAARNSHAPGLRTMASAPRVLGWRPRRPAEVRSTSYRERTPSMASHRRRAPPATFRIRSTAPLGRATESPSARIKRSDPNVREDPARARAPRKTPPRTASVSRTTWTGPGALARATPMPKAARTSEVVSGAMPDFPFFAISFLLQSLQSKEYSHEDICVCKRLSPRVRSLETKLSETALRAWQALLHAHHDLAGTLDAELREEHGLSLGAYDVLVRLARAPERALRMTELAERVMLSPSGLTRLVDQLCDEGLVQRERVQRDARVVLARLTTRGRQVVRQAARTHLRGIREHFTGRLSEAQLRNVASALETITSPHRPH